MGVIRILPDEVISKIAAGEIVERPASVVKELIENSLDAKSDKIKIKLLSGGRKLLSVEDNGTGMTKDDALMCIERYATSKIKNADDIQHINTLGFRGEALPSISSVSRFSITTKTRDQLSGVNIRIDGGVIKQVNEVGCPEGTLVEVKNLFYNTPPRLKFLKKVDTELSNVLDIVQRHAVSSYGVSYEITHNGRTILNLSARQDLSSRLKENFPNVELYEIESTVEDIRVYGYLSGPDHSRTSTYKLYTFVNGRPVKDRFLNRTIIAAYGRILDKGRIPVGVVFIDISPSDVDINVHPTKNEIRFQVPYKVSDIIERAILGMLEKAPWLKRSEIPNKNVANNKTKSSYRKSESNYFKDYRDSSNAPITMNVLREQYVGYESISVHNKGTEPIFNNDQEELFKKDGFFSGLEIAGQIGNLYIICESESGMVLIDQHAAHERVNYEKFKKQYEQNIIEKQNFLIPLIIELNEYETKILENNLAIFINFGLELEKFGENSYLLRSIPAIIGHADFSKIIIDVIGEISQIENEVSLKSNLDHIISTMACHSSIRANEKMDSKKIKFLLDDLDKTDMPHFCPHGRPVSKLFTFEELKRLFKRT